MSWFGFSVQGISGGVATSHPPFAIEHHGLGAASADVDADGESLAPGHGSRAADQVTGVGDQGMTTAGPERSRGDRTAGRRRRRASNNLEADVDVAFRGVRIGADHMRLRDQILGLGALDSRQGYVHVDVDTETLPIVAWADADGRRHGRVVRNADFLLARRCLSAPRKQAE